MVWAVAPLCKYILALLTLTTLIVSNAAAATYASCTIREMSNSDPDFQYTVTSLDEGVNFVATSLDPMTRKPVLSSSVGSVQGVASFRSWFSTSPERELTVHAVSLPFESASNGLMTFTSPIDWQPFNSRLFTAEIRLNYSLASPQTVICLRYG